MLKFLQEIADGNHVVGLDVVRFFMSSTDTVDKELFIVDDNITE